MKIWHIVNDPEEISIEIGKMTLLKGNHPEWFQLVRLINDFFNNRKSEVQIYEDTQLINIKDWECLFIPYDAHVTLEKINTKSPLRDLLDDICNKISLSPVYQELLDTWECLNEEIQLLQKDLESYDLKLDLKQFDVEDLKLFITFNWLNKVLSPVQFKILLLSLFENKIIEKKTLIILELPELFASSPDMKKLKSKMTELNLKGVNFIILTNNKFLGHQNYLVNGQIINEARIENLRKIIINELPFYCDEELYNFAKDNFLQLVDNNHFLKNLNYLSTSKDDKLLTILFLIAKKVGININIDISRLPSNIHSFLKAYS